MLTNKGKRRKVWQIKALWAYKDHFNGIFLPFYLQVSRKWLTFAREKMKVRGYEEFLTFL